MPQIEDSCLPLSSKVPSIKELCKDLGFPEEDPRQKCLLSTLHTWRKMHRNHDGSTGAELVHWRREKTRSDLQAMALEYLDCYGKDFWPQQQLQCVDDRGQIIYLLQQLLFKQNIYARNNRRYEENKAHKLPTLLGKRSGPFLTDQTCQELQSSPTPKSIKRSTLNKPVLKTTVQKSHRRIPIRVWEVTSRTPYLKAQLCRCGKVGDTDLVTFISYFSKRIYERAFEGLNFKVKTRDAEYTVAVLQDDRETFTVLTDIIDGEIEKLKQCNQSSALEIYIETVLGTKEGDGCCYVEEDAMIQEY